MDPRIHSCLQYPFFYLQLKSFFYLFLTYFIPSETKSTRIARTSLHRHIAASFPSSSSATSKTHPSAPSTTTVFDTLNIPSSLPHYLIVIRVPLRFFNDTLLRFSSYSKQPTFVPLILFLPFPHFINRNPSSLFFTYYIFFALLPSPFSTTSRTFFPIIPDTFCAYALSCSSCAFLQPPPHSYLPSNHHANDHFSSLSLSVCISLLISLLISFLISILVFTSAPASASASFHPVFFSATTTDFDSPIPLSTTADRANTSRSLY